MKWMADQYFGKIGNEFTRRDAPLGRCRPNPSERKDCGEESKLLILLQQEKDKLEENLSATYWG